MSKTITDQTLALAGIFQAVGQVQKVARQGRVDPGLFETSIRSIFITDAESTEEVYGGMENLREGLQAVTANLGNDARQRDVEQTRYLITLLHLERKLSSRREILDAIGRRIEDARRQAEHFSPTHANTIAKLADLYLHTVSTLTPRVIVTGEHGHLANEENASRVRALLLAGIRSAVLWSQSGGGRLRLLFRRKLYLGEAERLLRGG